MPFGTFELSHFIIAIIAIILGIVMIVIPKVVAFLVGAFLIIWGLFTLVGC